MDESIGFEINSEDRSNNSGAAISSSIETNTFEEKSIDPRLQSIGELDLESQLQVFEEILNDLKFELESLDNL